MDARGVMWSAKARWRMSPVGPECQRLSLICWFSLVASCHTTSSSSSTSLNKKKSRLEVQLFVSMCYCLFVRFFLNNDTFFLTFVIQLLKITFCHGFFFFNENYTMPLLVIYSQKMVTFRIFRFFPSKLYISFIILQFTNKTGHLTCFMFISPTLSCRGSSPPFLSLASPPFSFQRENFCRFSSSSSLSSPLSFVTATVCRSFLPRPSPASPLSTFHRCSSTLSYL